MGNPAEFELTEQRLRDKFSRIRLKCESLLAQRIDSLTKDLEGNALLKSGKFPGLKVKQNH